MGCFSTMRITVAAIVLISATTIGEAAGGPPVGTVDYIAHQQICVLGNCSTGNAPGRLTILGSGKILLFVATADRTALQAGGVMLQLGRTVDLAGRGRLPETVFGSLKPQGGSGSARFDGRHLFLSVSLVGAGPLNGGSATISARLSNTFDVDPASGKIVSGTGTGAGVIRGQRADGQPFSGPFAASSTLELR